MNEWGEGIKFWIEYNIRRMDSHRGVERESVRSWDWDWDWGSFRLGVGVCEGRKEGRWR